VCPVPRRIEVAAISTLYESFTVSLCHFYVCSSPMESRRKAFNSVAWRSAVLTIRAGGCTHQGHTELGSGRPNLRVTVVATNDRGTLAALRTAGKLAANLRARIALVKAQIVPFQFPLDKPPVSTDFLPTAALWPRVRSRDRGGRNHHTPLALPRQKRELTEDFAPAFFGRHRRPKALVVEERKDTGAIPQRTGPPDRLRRSRWEGQF
jgi:hypothetical protein